ncbi:MAG: non-canonical purine NTP pyrophosphatase [bacterium]
MKQIIYATTNPGKFSEVSKLFTGHGITIHAPSEFNIELDIEETDQTLEENAILKAETYSGAIQADVIVLGDDTGVEIDALGGEPGIHVRRWKGYKMDDEEIISYCLERMKDIKEGDRQAKFRTVIAVAKRGIPTKTFSGILPGRIVIKPHKFREEGLPFQPLFFSAEYKQMLYQIHTLSMKEKLAKNIITHRERAITAAIPHINSI